MVLGIAVLTAVFVARGGQGGSPQQFVHGLTSASWVAAAEVAVAAATAFAVPRRRREPGRPGAPAVVA